MKTKLLAVFLLVTAIGLMSNAYAHTSEVVGDYKVEVGWDKEPPIAEMANKITIMVTYATADEKVAEEMDHGDEKMSHDEMEHTDEEMSHDEMEHEEHEGMEHEHGEGISGLASNLDITVTLNGERTTLTMVEDEGMLGFYLADFTPSATGFPIVHFFTEIDGEPIEVDFHPEKVEDGALIQSITTDGSISIDIIATTPKQDDSMLIIVAFTDDHGHLIEHVNYDITATQNGGEILSETDSHTHREKQVILLETWGLTILLTYK